MLQGCSYKGLQNRAVNQVLTYTYTKLGTEGFKGDKQMSSWHTLRHVWPCNSEDSNFDSKDIQCNLTLICYFMIFSNISFIKFHSDKVSNGFSQYTLYDTIKVNGFQYNNVRTECYLLTSNCTKTSKGRDHWANVQGVNSNVLFQNARLQLNVKYSLFW